MLAGTVMVAVAGREAQLVAAARTRSVKHGAVTS